MPQKSEISILGIRLDCLNWVQLEQYCRKSLLEEVPRHIVTANGEILLKASSDVLYKSVLIRADLVIPESTNVALVLAFKGSPLKDITSGADLVNLLARIATEMNKSIYLLGATPGVAERAGERLQQSNPGLMIAGTSSSDPDDKEILDEIRLSKADIVLVAYGAPKQEVWISKHKTKLNAKILVGIGGTFDMLSGVTPRAPRLFRFLRLEWFWRLILQPTRMGRIWQAIIIFPLKALFSR